MLLVVINAATYDYAVASPARRRVSSDGHGKWRCRASPAVTIGAGLRTGSLGRPDPDRQWLRSLASKTTLPWQHPEIVAVPGPAYVPTAAGPDPRIRSRLSQPIFNCLDRGYRMTVSMWVFRLSFLTCAPAFLLPSDPGPQDCTGPRARGRCLESWAPQD